MAQKQQQYLSKPFTLLDMKAVAKQNRVVRNRLNAILKKQDQQINEANRAELMAKLVTAAAQIGSHRRLMQRSKPFPHPMLVAQFLQSLLDNPTLPKVAMSDVRAAEILGPIASAFRIPSREIQEYAVAYQRLIAKTSDKNDSKTIDQTAAHYFENEASLVKLDAPSGAALRGFRLTGIELEVPIGTKFVKTKSARRRFVPVPTHYRVAKIACDPESVLGKMCGEVWMAIARNRQGVQLAVQKMPKLTLEELLAIMTIGKKQEKKNATPYDKASLSALASGAESKAFEKKRTQLRAEQEKGSIQGATMLP